MIGYMVYHKGLRKGSGMGSIIETLKKLSGILAAISGPECGSLGEHLAIQIA